MALYYGVVHDGRIVLDGEPRLAEGLRVEVRPRGADADLIAGLLAAGVLERGVERRGPQPFEPVDVRGELLSAQIIGDRR